MSTDARDVAISESSAAPTDLVESLFAAPPVWEQASGDAAGSPPSRGSHSRRPRSSRRKLRGRLIPFLAVIVLVAVAIAGYGIVTRTLHSLKTPDYVGTGTGKVIIAVKSDDTAGDIATQLHTKNVVASTKAFLNAAAKSGRSRDFQPGWFTMRLHMSGKAAVATLLDPAARLSTTVTVPEGMIEPAVLALVSKKTRLSMPALVKASKDIKDLGLPAGFAATSAEGFLFPSTYQYDPDVTATEALQDMTTLFQAEVRKLKFVAAARALKLTPYQVLTIASMIEAEARFEQDRARVARVVLNRLALHMNIGFDSTTAYGLKIAGKDPRTATYKENSPYNTRQRLGLPPTPIGNPGEAALLAAEHPAPGNWLYFVSQDAAGHLFFTNDPKAFEAASKKCVVNKWGCT